jgi:hypothetical protein
MRAKMLNDAVNTGSRPWRGIAYKDEGRICGQLATILDVHRGGMVCAAHPPGPPPRQPRPRRAQHDDRPSRTGEDAGTVWYCPISVPWHGKSLVRPRCAGYCKYPAEHWLPWCPTAVATLRAPTWP